MSRYYQLIIQVETRKLFGYLQSWIGWEQMVDVWNKVAGTVQTLSPI